MSVISPRVLAIVSALAIAGIIISFANLDNAKLHSQTIPLMTDFTSTTWNSLQETASTSASRITNKILTSASVFASSFSCSLMKLDEASRLALIEHSNNFALKLIPQMTHGFAVSPLAISYALSVLHQGSYGTVQRELSKLFNGMYTMDELRMIKELYGNNQSNILHMSNYLVLNKDQVKFFNQTYIQEVRELVDVAIGDFNIDLNRLSKDISTYFETVTDNHVEGIGKVLKPKQSINIINTMYFRAPWYHNFESSMSNHLNFTQENGHKRSIKVLRAVVPLLPYYENEKLELFEIPFQPREFVMGIFLPKKSQDSKRPPSLLGQNMTELFSYIHLLKPYEEVKKSEKSPEVHLPKMREQKMLRLAPQLLKRLGLKDTFDSSKNQNGLSRIAKMGATLSETIHEAFFSIDEYGANSLREWEQQHAKTLRKEALVEVNPIIEASHTFLYYIRHKPTNMLIYVGDFDA